MKRVYISPINTHASIRWALYLIVPFFGFYTVKLGFSPIYLTFILGILALFIGSIKGIRCWRETSSILISAMLLTYITALFLNGWNYDSPLPSAWINLVFSLAYFIIISIVLENSTRNYVLHASELAISFSIALLVFELIYRLMHPAEPEDWKITRDDIFWYIYKTSSFMYVDSNSVGLFVACLIGFVLGLPPKDAPRFKKFLIPLVILLLGSLSRSAIVATSIAFIYRYMTGGGLKIILIWFASISGSIFSYMMMATDESLLSKFWIAALVSNYIITTDIFTLMTGVGPGNAVSVLGVGAHLLPFTFLIELGIVGSILKIALWLCIWRRTGKKGTPIFLVMLINGLSFTTFAIPWFYSMTAILIILTRFQQDNKSLNIK